MNKQNKILLGILAFVVACTIGYALFSETITINGTATAKGDFEVTTICGVMTYEENAIFNGNTAIKTGPITELSKNAVANSIGNTCTLSTELTAPGAKTVFYVTMTNTGTIPVTFNKDIPYSTVAGANTISTEDGSLISTINDNVTFSVSNCYRNDIATNNIPIILAGESITFEIEAKWDSLDTNKTGTNLTVSGTYTFNLEQVTAE